MTTISSADFRDRLSNVLNRAHFAQERIVITKHGDPVAAVVSIEDLRIIEALEQRSDIKAAIEAIKDTEENGGTVSLDTFIEQLRSEKTM